MMAVADLKFDTDLMDLDISTGDLALVSGNDACKQRLIMSLHGHRGNWAWDLTEGVPWAEWFRAKPAPLARMKQFLKRRLKAALGVSDIPSMEITVDAETRQATIDYDFTLADGEGGVDSTTL